MPLSAGQKLAAYEIISALGAGGMGEVYRARDARLGRDVALKVLPSEVTNEPGRLRLRAETSFIGNGIRACVAAAAGHWDQARELLRLAIDEHDPWVTFWKLHAWRPVWKDEQCSTMIKATSLFRGRGTQK